MNELALFAGAGGGLLASKLLGWRAVCYIENDGYCVKVLKARIKDGCLDDAPIWDDARTFDGKPWRGLVDVVTAGFPCQPFSVAGKRKADADERNLWPTTADIIGAVHPRFVLLENVPGIRPYLPVVIRDLRKLGYKVHRPLRLGADDCGADHRRKRIWILAYSTKQRMWPELALSKAGLCSVNGSQDVAHSTRQCLNGSGHTRPGWRQESTNSSSSRFREREQRTGENWRAVEPHVGRAFNGLAKRLDLLKPH